jgi:ABC-type glycerol-3-phosphate transport system permease component
MRSMTAPAEPYVPMERRTSDTAAFRMQGALAGLFGASLLASWFLYLDVLRGKPLFTPTLLATALLWGPGTQAPQTLVGSVWLTLLFTVVHGLVFVAVGIGAAYFLERFALFRTRALIILLIFGVLCLGFFAVAANISAIGPQGIAVRDAFIGNAIAAFAMGAYLARFLPPSRTP